MAANPTAENRLRERRARKVTAYDLVIGILAIFSLIILIPIYFGNLSSEDKLILTYLEDALCVVFLLDFFRSLHLAQSKWGYFLRGGGWLDLLGSIPISAFAIFRIARLFRVVRLLQKMTGGELRRMIHGTACSKHTAVYACNCSDTGFHYQLVSSYRRTGRSKRKYQNIS